MNKQELAAMVAEILSGMEHEPPVKGGDYRPTAPQPEKAPTPYRDGDFVPDVTVGKYLYKPYGLGMTAIAVMAVCMWIIRGRKIGKERWKLALLVNNIMHGTWITA